MPKITLLLEKYLQLFAHEREGLRPLRDQLRRKGEASLPSRREFDAGHLTAAGFVVRVNDHAVLLVEHAFLGKLLQPGGHMESGDAEPLHAAYREVQEEVGLAREQLSYVPLLADQPAVPFDIAIHRFPERKAKHEPPHYHYDFRFLFTVLADAQPALHPTEVRGAHWVPFAKFEKMPGFEQQATKIKRLLEGRAAGTYSI